MLAHRALGASGLWMIAPNKTSLLLLLLLLFRETDMICFTSFICVYVQNVFFLCVLKSVQIKFLFYKETFVLSG